MKVQSTNKIVANAIASQVRNSGIIDYSRYQPQDKSDVMADLETISGNSPADIADLKKIKPYAQKFGIIDRFNRYCSALGVKV